MSKHAKHCTQPDIDDTPHLSGQKKGGKMKVMATSLPKALVSLLTLYLSLPSIAQTAAPASPAAERTPSEIVQAQVEAYNRRDLEGFLSYYADDAQILFYPNELALSGKDAMRERYRKVFEPMELHATIPQRMAFDRFVIDKESVVTGRPDRPLIEAVAIYEIKEGRIARVTFLRQAPESQRKPDLPQSR